MKTLTEVTHSPRLWSTRVLMNNMLLFEHNSERKEGFIVYIILLDVKSDYHYIQHSGK